MAAGLGLSAMMLGAVAGLGPALAEDVRHPLGRPSLDALRKVQRWVWHSGPVEPRAVGRSPATMLVIDPEGVPAASVQRLRRPTRQFTRLVLAQIDLASVTATREPLRGMLLGSPPAWLGPAGCGSGRRHVRYWSAAWQDILFRDQDSYIMRLLERGYDGVVLGGLEAYLRWQPERWQAAAEMAELVSELAIAVRLRRPGALVLVRNGEEIASQATVLASIDGIIRVDLMYGGEGRGRAKHESTVARSMRNLGAARRAGLPVFAFERRALHGGLHSSATLVAGLGLVLGEVIGGGEAAPSVALPPAFEEAGWPHC
jgi:uncharacterized protein (TIGR01370 family)